MVSLLESMGEWSRASGLYRVLGDLDLESGLICSGCFSYSSGGLDSGLFWLFFLESWGIGLGPVLDVGLDLGNLLHLLVVGLHQGVLVLGELKILSNQNFLSYWQILYKAH